MLITAQAVHKCHIFHYHEIIKRCQKHQSWALHVLLHVARKHIVIYQSPKSFFELRIYEILTVGVERLTMKADIRLMLSILKV